MLLHTILMPGAAELARQGLEVGHEQVLFAKFIRDAIFPGGQLVPRETVLEHARAAGFALELTQSLRPHYARTLDVWAGRLEQSRERAVALTSPGVFETYMKYLTGCAHYFRTGYLDVVQFTLTV